MTMRPEGDHQQGSQGDHSDDTLRFDLPRIEDDEDDDRRFDTLILRRVLSPDAQLEATYDGVAGGLFHRLRPLSSDVVSVHTILQPGWKIADLFASKEVVKQLMLEASYNNPNHPPVMYNFILFSPRLNNPRLPDAIPNRAVSEVQNFLLRTPRLTEGHIVVINPPEIYRYVINAIRTSSPAFAEKFIVVECHIDDAAPIIEILEQMMKLSNFAEEIAEVAPHGVIKGRKNPSSK